MRWDNERWQCKRSAVADVLSGSAYLLESHAPPKLRQKLLANLQEFTRKRRKVFKKFQISKAKYFSKIITIFHFTLTLIPSMIQYSNQDRLIFFRKPSRQKRYQITFGAIFWLLKGFYFKVFDFVSKIIILFAFYNMIIIRVVLIVCGPMNLLQKHFESSAKHNFKPVKLR